MAVLASFHPAHQASAILPFHQTHWPPLGEQPSARTMPPATLATSISSTSIPSIDFVSLQNNATLAHYDALDIPSSASPELGLDNMLPTGT